MPEIHFLEGLLQKIISSKTTEDALNRISQAAVK
jgi:hypothetical protein